MRNLIEKVISLEFYDGVGTRGIGRGEDGSFYFEVVWAAWSRHIRVGSHQLKLHVFSITGLQDGAYERMFNEVLRYEPISDAKEHIVTLHDLSEGDRQPASHRLDAILASELTSASATTLFAIAEDVTDASIALVDSSSLLRSLLNHPALNQTLIGKAIAEIYVESVMRTGGPNEA